MRAILKQKRCDKLTDWLSQEQHDLLIKYNDATIKADTIWNILPQDIKNELADQLLKEQGYICCYCGQRINRDTMAIEHFYPKSKYKSEMFDYQNLFASCKCSDKKYYPYSTELDDTTNLNERDLATRKIAQGIAIIAQKTGKNKDVIKLEELDKNYGLWHKGDDIAYSEAKSKLNLRHCDDKKDNLDPRITDNFIINPSDSDVEEYFEYDAYGKITVNHSHLKAHQNICEEVLNLNTSKLCNLRYEVYKKANIRSVYYRSLHISKQLNVTQLRAAIENLNKVTDNKELNEFCFVEQYAIKKLLAIQ